MEHFSETLLSAFGNAQAAIARADERLSLSRHPNALLARFRFLQQEALGYVEGEFVSPDRLATDYGFSPHSYRRWPFHFVRIFDTPLPSRLFPSPAIVCQWLQSGDPAQSEVAVNENKLAIWARNVTSAHALPRLLAGADLAAAWANTAPLPQGNLVTGVMLGDYYSLVSSQFSAGGTVAIGLMRKQLSWMHIVSGSIDDEHDDISAPSRAERYRIMWLGALEAGASAFVELDKRLRIWRQALDGVLTGKRRSSQLGRMADYAIERPSFTAHRAACDLGLSRQGTNDLLAEATAAHLLREITGGASFRRYQVTI